MFRIRWIDSNLLTIEECRTCRYILGNGCSFAVSSYNIIVARTFFNNSIPEGMWEAAQIDGCGTIRYFFKIVVPLSKAIIAVIGLWTAVGIWNSWFNALIYLTKENLQPLQLIFKTVIN